MGSYENLFATVSGGVLKSQNGAYINNSLTATLQATFGFSGVVNGRTLLLDPRYLRKAEAVYVSVNDPVDRFTVNWVVDNRKSSMGSPVVFSPVNASITGLDATDGAGQYKLEYMRLEDYWPNKGSNLKYQNYSVNSSPFFLNLITAPNYTYQMSASGTVAEGASAEFTITRVGATGFSSMVYLSTVSGTAIAGTDFTALNKAVVTFGENETSRTIRVKVNMDLLVESNESFTGQLFLKNTDTTANAQQQITVTNTEPNFAYTASALTVATEGGGVSFRIERTGTTDLASTVFVSTASGTALDGLDYVGLQRTAVQFAAGASSATVQVVTRDDLLAEAQENFALHVFSSASAPSPAAVATGLINNRDAVNLTGTAAPDTIIGNALDNVMTGLGGGDVLTGGAGRDVFRYVGLSDSGLTPLARDRITDFRKGEDKIDLSAIDANPLVAGDQAFGSLISITTAFNQPGQIKINHNGSFNYTVFLNTNTNLAAEASITVQLVGVPAGQTSGLGLSDFTL